VAEPPSVLAVDDDPPAERNPDVEVAAAVTVEVEAAVRAAETCEERQVDGAVGARPAEELRRLRSCAERRRRDRESCRENRKPTHRTRL
jgi:hypothetical protein